MKSGRGKFIVLAAVLMLAITPALADEHLNETDEEDSDVPEDDSDTEEDENESETEEPETEENETEETEIDGTDDSSALTVDKSKAEETARNSLSDNKWELESSSTHEEDGYYRFRFTVPGEEAEAEIRVDGSSGEVFRQEEEMEKGVPENESEVEQLEKVEVENLEQARNRISELREKVMSLRKKVARLKAENSGTETEAEFEREDGETSAEAERETPRGETEAEMEREAPSQEAQENTNGTPGNEQAQQTRPGFVSQMLSGFFG